MAHEILESKEVTAITKILNSKSVTQAVRKTVFYVRPFGNCSDCFADGICAHG